MLYLLGLSYGAVSLAMDALGVYLCKSRVYDAVQAVAERVPGLRREKVFGGLKTPALGGDLTSVKVNGQWLTLGLTVDDTSGMVLTVDGLDGEDTETLRTWMEPIAEAVEARIVVTDDADAFKTVTSELGLEQQVCKGHVKRNTEGLIEDLQTSVTTDSDGSLAATGITPEQAVADLERLAELIQTRRPEDVAELDRMSQELHDAEETRDQAIAYLQQREADLTNQLSQTEAELRAAMDGLRDARHEAEELRAWIQQNKADAT
jgi:transposase-like protein